MANNNTLAEQVRAALKDPSLWAEVHRTIEKNTAALQPNRIQWTLYQAARAGQLALIKQWIFLKDFPVQTEGLIEVCEKIANIFTSLEHVRLSDNDWQNLFFLMGYIGTTLDTEHLKNNHTFDAYTNLISELYARAFASNRLELFKKIAGLPYATEISELPAVFPTPKQYLSALQSHDWQSLESLYLKQILRQLRQAGHSKDWNKIENLLKIDGPTLPPARLQWLLTLACRHGQTSLIDHIIDTIFQEKDIERMQSVCENIGQINTSLKNVQISNQEWEGLIHLIKRMNTYEKASVQEEHADFITGLLEDLVVRAFIKGKLEILQDLSTLPHFSEIKRLDLPAKYSKDLLLALQEKNEQAVTSIFQTFKTDTSPQPIIVPSKSLINEMRDMMEPTRDTHPHAPINQPSLFFQAPDSPQTRSQDANPLHVFSIDYDGCLAHRDYHQVLRFLSGEKKTNPEIRVKSLIKVNKALIDDFKQQMNANPTLQDPIIFSGSTRQSIYVEYVNLKRHHHLPSSCLDIEALAKALGAQFCPLLMEDAYFNWLPGETFSQIKGLELSVDTQSTDLYQERVRVFEEHLQKHPEERSFYADESKVAVLFLQMWEIALAYPEKIIKFHFYDDKTEGILDELAKLYNASPFLIPGNLDLTLHHYAKGEIQASFPPIVGTGKLDTAMDHYQIARWILAEAQQIQLEKSTLPVNIEPNLNQLSKQQPVPRLLSEKALPLFFKAVEGTIRNADYPADTVTYQK